MNKRIVVVGMLAALAAGAISACEVVAGLERATLYETGGGGTGAGGHGGTTTNSGGTTGTGGTTSSGGTTTNMPCDPGTQIPCYSGPPGTEGKSSCHGGMATCKADGSGYDACVGEQLPGVETCASTEDEDCDGFDCARWAVLFGDGSEQKPLDIKTDGQGNVYVLGAFKGAIKFGSQPRVSAGAFDLFLVKLDPAGNVIWDQQFGDAADQQQGRIAVSPGGNVAIAGKLVGTLNFGGQDLQNADIFVAALDANGGHVWSKGFLATMSGYPEIAAGGDGNLVLWTEFLGSANFGGAALSSATDRKVVLLTLNALDGALLWQKSFVSTGQPDVAGSPHNHTFAFSVVTDASGNISVSGAFRGKQLSLGGQAIMEQAADLGGYFLGRFDKLGNPAWSLGSVAVRQLAVDAVGGLASFVLDDADGFAPCASAYVSEFSNVGVKQWTNKYSCSGPGSDFESIVGAVDPGSAVVVSFVPAVGDIVDFNGNSLPANGGLDVVLGKLDSAGAYLWARRFGDAADQRYPQVATAPNGDIVMAAQVSGTIDVGTGPLVSNGQDLLVARFAP